ncbi:hypothetical protein NDU88_008389 [Pleurodeles waltl]|uniref:Uncharacterized protein n=1 Tax=Pleurodeles waltl TaxID=8319 RepID=A0AAV7QRM3_PLEWA|nr:hypothetical protein NDU88_008389 [Pleurodeles waltl]
MHGTGVSGSLIDGPDMGWGTMPSGLGQDASPSGEGRDGSTPIRAVLRCSTNTLDHELDRRSPQLGEPYNKRRPGILRHAETANGP